MNLRKKKMLAAKTLGVGKNKIIFVKSRLDEIKEAITKQDIRDLYSEKAIIIREKAGRGRKEKKGRRKGAGNIRKKIRERKRKYVILTRKLRKRLDEFRKGRRISGEQVQEARKRIKNRNFKNQAAFNEYLKSLSM
jgi:large subunit ribosomal protein L19e